MKKMTENQLSQYLKAEAQPNSENISAAQNAGFAKVFAIIGSHKLAFIVGLILIGGLLAYAFLSYRAINDPWAQTLVTPCAAEKTCVVIAELKDDSKAAQTDHVISEIQDLFDGGLKGNTDVQIIRAPISLDPQLIAPHQTKKDAAERKARDWLEYQRADILIYGRVDKKAQLLKLSLLSAKTGSNENGEDVYAQPIINHLPLNFSETMSGVFLAALQSQGHPIVKDYNLPNSARFIDKKIDHLAAQMPEGLSPQTAAEAHLMYSLSAYQDGERYALLEDVDIGIEHMQKAIDLTSGDRETLEWSQKNYYLARMLETKHKFSQVTARQQDQMKVLEQIIEAYRAARISKVLSSDLEKWGESQIRFSSALLNLGGFRRDEDLIDESMVISQKALTVFKDDSPRHIKNRTSATLWFALGLNRKGDLSSDKKLKIDAVQVLKDLHREASNRVEVSDSVTEKIQNLIIHLENQQNLGSSL